MLISWISVGFLVVYVLFFVPLGIIMILAASFEFEKGHNNDVQERPSDNLELPQVSFPGDCFSMYFNHLYLIKLISDITFL